MNRRKGLNGKGWDEVLAGAREAHQERDDPRIGKLLEAVEAPVRELAEEVPPLMGAREAAECLGVKVPNLRKVAGLPDPDREIASGPVWAASKIKALARQRTERRRVDG